MKTKLPTKIFLISFVVLMFVGFYAITQQSGPSGGVTNAPGDGNCTSCHNGTLVTTGTNWTNIKLTSNIPASGYIPDSTYTMTLSQTQTGINRFGFQLTALLASNNTKAGTLIVTNTTSTRLRTGTRDYIEHTSAGSAASGSAISWTFNWRAPATNLGNIVFYSVVLATNSNGSTSGDMTIAKTFTYSVSTLLPTSIINVADSTVCVGDTVFLSGSGANNPTSWAWTMASASPTSSTVQNPKIIYNTTGTFTVSLITTNSKGVSFASTKKIYVSAKPTASITPVGPINLCKGDSVALVANTGTGFSYLWSTSKTTASIYVKTSGIYYVIVTNSTGCSVKSNQVIVNVYNAPSVALTSSPNDSICKGTPVLFNAKPTNYKNYTFKSGTTILQNSIKSDYTASAILNGTSVFVAVTDSNNCSANSNSITTRVFNPLDTPKVTCGTPTSSSIEFKWSAVTNAVSYEVSEDSGKTWKTPSSGANGLSHQISGLTFSVM